MKATTTTKRYNEFSLATTSKNTYKRNSNFPNKDGVYETPDKQFIVRLYIPKSRNYCTMAKYKTKVEADKRLDIEIKQREIDMKEQKKVVREIRNESINFHSGFSIREK